MNSYHALQQPFPVQRAKNTEKKKNRRKLENFTRKKERKKIRFLYNVLCSMRDRTWSFFKESAEGWDTRSCYRLSVLSFQHCWKILCKAVKWAKAPIREGSSQRKVLVQNLSYSETAKQGTASTVKHQKVSSASVQLLWPARLKLLK